MSLWTPESASPITPACPGYPHTANHSLRRALVEAAEVHNPCFRTGKTRVPMCTVIPGPGQRRGPFWVEIVGPVLHEVLVGDRDIRTGRAAKIDPTYSVGAPAEKFL